MQQKKDFIWLVDFRFCTCVMSDYRKAKQKLHVSEQLFI